MELIASQEKVVTLEEASFSCAKDKIPSRSVFDEVKKALP
jgi:hypothetical protein